MDLSGQRIPVFSTVCCVMYRRLQGLRPAHLNQLNADAIGCRHIAQHHTGFELPWLHRHAHALLLQRIAKRAQVSAIGKSEMIDVNKRRTSKKSEEAGEPEATDKDDAELATVAEEFEIVGSVLRTALGDASIAMHQ